MKKRNQPQEQTTTKPINMQIPESVFKIYSILKPLYPSDQLKKQERERKNKSVISGFKKLLMEKLKLMRLLSEQDDFII